MRRTKEQKVGILREYLIDRVSYSELTKREQLSSGALSTWKKQYGAEVLREARATRKQAIALPAPPLAVAPANAPAPSASTAPVVLDGKKKRRNAVPDAVKLQALADWQASGDADAVAKRIGRSKATLSAWRKQMVGRGPHDGTALVHVNGADQSAQIAELQGIVTTLGAAVQNVTIHLRQARDAKINAIRAFESNEFPDEFLSAMRALNMITRVLD